MQTKAACINTFYHEMYSCDGKVKYSANLLHVIMSSTFQRGFDIVNPLKQNKTRYVQGISDWCDFGEMQQKEGNF